MSIHCRAVLAAVAAVTLSVPATATAQSAEAMLAAGKQLSAKVNATSPDGEPPLLTNADGALVRAAFDRATVRSLSTRSKDDLLTVGKACGAIGEALLAYGNLISRAAAKPGGDEAMAAKVEDETSLGSAAANICGQRAFRAAEAVVAGPIVKNSPTLLEGLKQMREGATQIIDGSLLQITNPRMKASNVAMILSATIEDAPATAASFPVDERKSLRTQILGYATRVPATWRRRVETLAAAFGTTQCNILCQTAGGN